MNNLYLYSMGTREVKLPVPEAVFMTGVSPSGADSPLVGAVQGRDDAKKENPAPKVYLLNGISPTMFSDETHIYIEPDISIGEVKEILSKGFISAIGHESTAKLLSNLLEIEVKVNRIQVVLKKRDAAVIVTLKFRPEEGKVYSYEELMQLYLEGKIMFTYLEVLGYWV